jgi:hypothetical protein
MSNSWKLNKVLSDIEKHNVKIYEFPLCDSDDDETFKKIDEEIKVNFTHTLYIYSSLWLIFHNNSVK